MTERLSTLDLAQKLISFDTTSRNPNMALIDFVAGYLNEYAVPSIKIENEEGTKANLYATIGPDIAGGIVLSGHTDVVPVDGQDWDHDPFAPRILKDNLFGRGSADMKSFIASALAAVPDMKNQKLKTPLHLAFSYDEELGCTGVQSLLTHIDEHLPKPRIVIVGEPTSMKVVNAHKGIKSFKTKVTGLEAHSSRTHEGVNAIVAAAHLINFLSKLAAEMRDRGDPSGRFDPPYTSMNIGAIKGGTAINIIPKECSFGWEYRPLPGGEENEIEQRFEIFANEELLPQLRETFDGANIETTITSRCPGLNVTEGSPAESLVLALAEQNETHAVSYTTEAGLFEEIGVSAVVCGPGDIAQAHKPNEFVSLSDLERCDQFLGKLIDHARTH
jgi:acetylornithine deacetylase